MGRCETCHYFKVQLADAAGSNANAGKGQCHRFPPTAVPIQDGQGNMGAMAIRPPVNKADGCGEHMPAEGTVVPRSS